MSTFVLVHGAFHGGWCWRAVADRLRAAGHAVHAPTLTGLGERSHLLSRSIDVETHITDVVNVLVFEDLREVVLVGHSYAGMIVTGVADRIPERLRALVYLDAVVIDNGETWSSVHPPHVVQARTAEADTHGFFPAPSPEVFGVTEPAGREWVARHLTAHPAGTYRQPLSLQHPIGNAIAKTYIDCTSPRYSTLNRVKARVRADPQWRVVELATAHDAMVTAPEELSRILEAL